jgi:hypothetical protein
MFEYRMMIRTGDDEHFTRVVRALAALPPVRELRDLPVERLSPECARARRERSPSLKHGPWPARPPG